MPGWRWLLVLVLFGQGCASYSTRLSPRPIPKGETELGLSADLWVSERKTQGRATLPVAEMSLRYGLSERVDIGGKINLLGGELTAKVALLRNDVVAIAVAPGAGLQLSAANTDNNNDLLIGTFHLPVLAGVRLGDSAEAIIGGKLLLHVPAGTGTDGGVNPGDLIFLPGGVLGLRLILGDNFALFPELNVHFPYNIDLERWRRVVFQGGLGFQFLL
jgi:hypothetical protein